VNNKEFSTNKIINRIKPEIQHMIVGNFRVLENNHKKISIRFAYEIVNLAT